MIVKMRLGSTSDQVEAIESLLQREGYKTGRLQGSEVTLIGVYGDISSLPKEYILRMSGVDELIPISKEYKRAAQKGTPGNLLRNTFRIGNGKTGFTVGDGEKLLIIAGPCSVESEVQIMESARMVKNAGGNALRGGVVKYRSSPYSGWEGIGAGSLDDLRRGLAFIVNAGKEYGLPTVVEVLDPNHVSIYEDAGVDCLQVGEPNARNQALLDRLRETPLPVIHKRASMLDVEKQLLWTERIMRDGKENVIICERGITGPNGHTRNVFDLGGIPSFLELSCLPVAADPSHATGIRDYVTPASRAAVDFGAHILLIEAHPNPYLAKSDARQALFPEQLDACVLAAQSTWGLKKSTASLHVLTKDVEGRYKMNEEVDRKRLFGGVYVNGGTQETTEEAAMLQ